MNEIEIKENCEKEIEKKNVKQENSRGKAMRSFVA